MRDEPSNGVFVLIVSWRVRLSELFVVDHPLGFTLTLVVVVVLFPEPHRESY
jgi:hypothetical protein